MFRVIYESTPVEGLGPLEVSQLVTKGNLNNAQQNITSYLLHLKHNFLQVIDGGPREVSALVDRIWNDPRHTKMSILASTHDQDSNRYSQNHPLTYIDMRNMTDGDREFHLIVYNSLVSLRRETPAVDRFLSQYETDIEQLNVA